ncbi:uncharacterized protein EDB91DRAFT_1170674 [Suillus paluster]|uniref:uncharacterized protein n=1 Tax=Suillus paluster TaxID=48578 RepID=UPI001B875034|nr:uncharacterized protein EDB91DRAFT_1170674 [Suillus paluster]KAG1724582.1 hypothetical protein EDB91DRAFT_1170674 [Suillus paluster]
MLWLTLVGYSAGSGRIFVHSFVVVLMFFRVSGRSQPLRFSTAPLIFYIFHNILVKGLPITNLAVHSKQPRLSSVSSQPSQIDV